MNNNDALIYCISAKNSLQKLSNNSATMQGIREEAKQWAVHFAHYSFNELRDLIASCARNNVRSAQWSENDVNGVAWFIGVYSIVAVEAKLASDFDTIFKAAFVKYFN